MKKKYTKKQIQEAINYWQKQLNMMNESKITEITLDTRWYDTDEAREEIKRLKKKYNISATFNGGKRGDHYSSMTYRGTKENIKKFLDVEYIPYFDEDVIDFLCQ